MNRSAFMKREEFEYGKFYTVYHEHKPFNFIKRYSSPSMSRAKAVLNLLKKIKAK